MRMIRAFVQDGVSWGLLLVMLLIVVTGFSFLFHRYEQIDQEKERMLLIEYDIAQLKQQRADKEAWLERLENDPTVWEQLAREKMNYLRQDEVLVTFTPAG